VDRNVEGAVLHCKDVISDLLQNKIDLSLLVITKSLSKKMGEDGSEGGLEEEKKPEKKDDKVYNSKMAHVELAKKLKKRDGEGNTL